MISNNRTRNLIVLIGLFIGLAAVASWYLRSSKNQVLKYSVRFAVPKFQSSALVFLAAEKGYFQDEGVDASFEYRATGRDCLELVLQGKSDLAVVYETPVSHALLDGRELSILTQLHSSEKNTAIVARRDRGIESANELVGKKIAAVPKTNAEFLLSLYLRTHLIEMKSVHIETHTVKDALEALSSGTVDAAALWEPYTSQAVAHEPKKYILLQSSFYSEFSMLTGLRETVDSKSDAMYAILRALIKAQNYMQNNPERSRQIVEEKLVSIGAFVSPKAWETTNLHLGLSSTLLTILNEEIKWYTNSEKTQQQLPDLKLVLDGKYLTAINPLLVTFE